MGTDLRVAFSRMGKGWLGLALQMEGRQFSTTFSDVPYDSLLQLAEALHGFYVNGLAGSVRFNGEPEEHELHLEPAGSERATVRLVRYPGFARVQGTGTEVFTVEAPRRDLVLAFWRALRRLETGFAANGEPDWRFEFPHRAVAQLGAAVRS
jgi:hypothetical protein